MTNELRVPTFCPLCSCIMKGSRSTQSYYDWGVCINCVIQFIEGREQRWRDGWRPTVEQIASYVADLY